MPNFYHIYKCKWAQIFFPHTPMPHSLEVTSLFSLSLLPYTRATKGTSATLVVHRNCAFTDNNKAGLVIKIFLNYNVFESKCSREWKKILVQLLQAVMRREYLSAASNISFICLTNIYSALTMSRHIAGLWKFSDDQRESCSLFSWSSSSRERSCH